MSSISSFADFVHGEIGSPTSPSVISISGWAENNLGILNIYIDECFNTDSGDFSPAFDNTESGIYKEIYMVKYFESRIRDAVNNVANKGTGANLDWVEIRDGDSVIRRSSPAEMSRIYRGLKTDAENSLKELIHKYNMYKSGPTQIVGEEWI